MATSTSLKLAVASPALISEKFIVVGAEVESEAVERAAEGCEGGFRDGVFLRLFLMPMAEAALDNIYFQPSQPWHSCLLFLLLLLQHSSKQLLRLDNQKGPS